MSEAFYMPYPQPFWFVDSEVLMDLIAAEIALTARLLTENPEVPNWFENSETDTRQRKICFTVAARRTILADVSETIAARYEVARPLNEDESETIRRINNLIASDAPAWASEMQRVIERMPTHLYAGLPESLRRARIDESIEQTQAIEALSTVEHIQTFIQGVIDQQAERLAKRWTKPVITIEVPRPQKPKIRRARDKQRATRYQVIAEIAGYSESQAEFLKSMDDRKVRPQPTWVGWPDSWSKAYKDKRLRKLIQQDKSRALAYKQRRE
jgi:hypothetical protein